MRTLPFLLHSLSVARAATTESRQRPYGRFPGFCPRILERGRALIGRSFLKIGRRKNRKKKKKKEEEKRIVLIRSEENRTLLRHRRKTYDS